jgi:hypothetical protein
MVITIRAGPIFVSMAQGLSCVPSDGADPRSVLLRYSLWPGEDGCILRNGRGGLFFLLSQALVDLYAGHFVIGPV